jgi:hypothetical protein
MTLTRVRENVLWVVRRKLQDSKYFFCYLIATALFLSVWHSRVIHHFSVWAFAVFVVFCGLSLIYGRLFIKFTSLSFKATHGLSIQFLCGYLLLNTLLFLLVLSTPFGFVTNVFILSGAGLLLLFISPGVTNDIRKPVDYLPDFLCLLLSGIAITLWCADSLRPVIKEGPTTIYQTFTDSFYHSRQISTFAQGHGLKTISDVRMVGLPPRLYHYASYMMSAAVMSCTHSGAYATFVSFHVPFGLLLTGLAAFSLATSIWGMWPGLAGTVAVMLLPDAYQQGFGNKLFSYYFVQQAGSTGLYGVVCVTIAWIFILDGCRAGRFASILCGYVVLIISLTYKAHFFVANAFLLMIYPCIFFRGLRISWRIISAVLLTSLFAFVVSVSQRLESIPTLRLDGSSIRPYARFLLLFTEPGFFKSLFYGTLVLHRHSNAIFGLCLAGMILMSTFGCWIIVYVFISFSLRARIGAAAFFFPLFVTVNYIVMSVGLAEDARGISYAEELLHRPFVWAYFVLAAWTGAGVYAFLFGNGLPRRRSARILTAILVVSSFSVPVAYGHNIQTLPTFERYASYRAVNSVPSALTKACLYIRKHSRPEDLIQDSENDPRFVITGLAERQDFALDCKLWSWNRNPIELRNRLEELTAFKKMGNEADLTEFIRRHKISWYLLRPESEVAWPISFRERSVFNSGGYRVYRFTP